MRPTAKTGKRMDFYKSLISVQQENGRIIIYGGILAVVDLILAIIVAHTPPPDVYFVPGAQGVAEQPIYWNRSPDDMRRILAGTAYEGQVEPGGSFMSKIFSQSAATPQPDGHAVEGIAPAAPQQVSP